MNRMSIPRNRLKTQHYDDVATGRRLPAVHPGQVLLTEFIEPLGITRYRVSKSIGVQQRRIDEICAGNRAVTADTAVRLGLAFGVDPEFWLNLQAQYDIEMIEREQGARLAEEVRPIAA
jgi:addiction module HigA family antidote